ncbi:hypothetical protein JCM5350_006541 [Sporobolomyces pararoseus]
MDPPTTPSTSTVQPEFTILGNSPALHSLKRQQLIQLCKQFNLKANGKNVELIERLKQHGKDLSPALARDRSVDGSNTSWDLVSNTDVPDQNDLKEFGFNQSSNAGLSTSGSNSSLASTIKSAGTAVFKKFTQPSHQPATSSSSIYPSLQEAFKKYPLSPPKNGAENEREEEDHDQTLEDFDHSVEGAIRRVTTHTTANTSIDTASLASPVRPPITHSPFVFGSPISHQTPQSSFNFELSMPGSLLSLSTTSSIRAGDVAGDERGGNGMIGTQVSILEEMNRRALESRKEAEKSGISLAKTSERGLVLASTNGRSPEKGKKEEEFDGKHKRVFDQMDSITNHYAAKRPHPSRNSSSTLAKSSSSKTLNSSSNERPTKRIKPSLATTSTTSKNLVSALRDSGWSSEAISSKETTTKVEKVSLKNSIRGVANSLSGGSLKSTTALDSFREEREKEREMRKRKLELAKARRKSGAQGTQKRRSTAVGCEPFPLLLCAPNEADLSSSFLSSAKDHGSISSKASSLLKSTFKRLTTSSSIVTPAPPSETPRFAIPTASSSSRVVSSSIRSNLVSSTMTGSLSSSAINPTLSNSPKKNKGEPGWKKFDLQESLKRPMTWKTHLTASSSLSSKPSTLSRSKSNASLLSPPPLSRQVSARVANPTLLTAARPPSSSVSNQPSASVPKKESIAEKLASLPPAPSTPFSNLSNNSIKSKGAAITQSRKLVSSTTKKARSGKSQINTGKIEGLETKARKIRAV